MIIGDRAAGNRSGLKSERDTQNNLCDQCLTSVVVALERRDNHIDRAVVFEREPPSECVAQHFRAQIPQEQILAGEEHLLEFLRPAEDRSIRQLTRSVDRGAAFSIAPTADYVVVLEREAERVDAAVAA